MKATNTYDQFAEQYETYMSGRHEKDLVGDPCASAFFGAIGEVDGLRVLDAGCGEGFVARILESKGAIVTGVDVSPKLVEKAKQRSKESIEYLVADLSEPLPQLAEHFDVISSFFVLNDVPDYQGFISTLGSLTKPGGRAVLLLNNPYSAVLRKKVDTYFDSGTSRKYFIGVNHYHQTMGEYIKAFSDNGFFLRNLLEPAPGPNEPEERRIGWVQVPFIIVLEFVKIQS